VNLRPLIPGRRDIPAPLDYRGVGGKGDTDDSEGLQKWLDDVAITGVGRGAAGTYGTLKRVTATSGRVIGAGARAFTICKLPGFPPDQQLLTNRNITTGAPIDRDIGFEHCGFKGLPDDESVTVQLVGFAGVSDPHIHRCLFANHRYIGLSTEACYRPRITDNELTDFGHRTPVERSARVFQYEGGAALYMWENGGAFNILPWVTGNHIHDCEWIGLSIQGERGHVTDNTFERLYEADIFGAFTIGVIHGNISKDVWVKDGSGHTETGGVLTNMFGNVMVGHDLAGIWLTNPEEVLVAINIISAINQKKGLQPKDLSAAIMTRTTTGKPLNVQLVYNMVDNLKGGAKYLLAPGATAAGM